MGMDAADEVTGYDEVDSDQVFNGGFMGGSHGPSGEGRRRGKKSLSSRGPARARPRRSPAAGIGSMFSSGFRHFEDTAKAMLAISIGALVLCAVVLYATFGLRLLPGFYGALVASIVVMALLFYTASRLVGAR